MSHLYSAENHDWALTLRGAQLLLEAGYHADKDERTGNISMGFAQFTGSMLMSFCAVESFTTSVALVMSRSDRFSHFGYQKFLATRRFKERITMVAEAAGCTVDWSQGLLQKLLEMQKWRNLVTHALPYAIDETEVEDTTQAPRRLHAPFRDHSYLRRAEFESAKEFYETAFDYIDWLKQKSGIEPRSQATYKLGGADDRN